LCSTSGLVFENNSLDIVSGRAIIFIGGAGWWRVTIVIFISYYDDIEVVNNKRRFL
jgi:hypothetical protein